MSALNDLIWMYLFGGSGGSADVTAAAVTAAIGSSNATQQNTIRNALNVPQKPSNVGVEGTDPTITPEANTLYHCGTLTSLTVSNPPATGKFWIWFTSGATATAVTGIDNFTPEANKVYRISVENGYATYDSWSVGGGS